MKDRNFTVGGGPPQYRQVVNFIHLGRVDTHGAWRYPPHLHENIEVILVKRGSVRWGLDGRSFDSKAGDLYFVMPGQRHEDASRKTPLFFYYLKFTLKDLRGKPVSLLPAGSPPERQILPGRSKVFLRAFEDIHREVLGDAPGSREIIEARILECLWLLRRELGLIQPPADPTQARRAALVEEVKQFLAARVERPPGARDLARQFGLSEDHLGQVFRRATGMSPLAWASALRMEEARRLLAESAMPVGEIARQLGFDDAAYFSRRFARSVGVSPGKFRGRRGAPR